MTASVESLKPLTSGGLLQDPATNTVYVAVANTHVDPGGVMPHVAPDRTVDVQDTNVDGSVDIIVRHASGSNEMDGMMRAYPVPEPLATQLLRAAGLTPESGP